jgi:hypothetical protein
MVRLARLLCILSCSLVLSGILHAQSVYLFNLGISLQAQYSSNASFASYNSSDVVYPKPLLPGSSTAARGFPRAS